MSPKSEYQCTGKLFEDDFAEEISPAPLKKEEEYKQEIVWKNVGYIVYFHVAALYGLYLIFTSGKIETFLFSVFLFIFSGLGITCGAHRLYAHRSFKATTPLKILFMIMNSMAFEDSIYEWVRNHRVHHKFTETTADPHDSRRGFFFSHCGWLMIRKHPDVKRKGQTVDVSDLEQDSVIMFQKKYYKYLMPFFTFFVPTIIPVLFWGESLNNAFHIAGMFRYTYLTNMVWLVNSAAHIYGMRPYDKNINPRENRLVAFLTLGEGWHNYHHVFPWDYRSSELGLFRYNFTTRFIDWMGQIGWAYDMKSVSRDIIQKRAKRTGDGSYYKPVWGWDDQDLSSEIKKDAFIRFSKTE
ncbi:acyl-CoA Delta(11) desaturase [Nilaparvata lugens]|uniref:Desaturase 3 n=1 Tax=Nilaparvata lugens TaxID=108931 RepID=A0A4D6C9E9_NILLU|nr:acyl-CoA Delta(11) desaturase [Nilaparvata lugens]QBY26788.1 desaturase 3 [Nilaparvata lugens]